MRQKQALRVMLEGNSVFLTGAPGAGKTYTIREFIKRSFNHGKIVAVTASTGIAATHIGGSTIHSWAGIGVRDELSPKDLDRMLNNALLFKRINSTDILVIDEVSMLHGIRLDMVDELCRLMRASDKPFGGIQVVLVGDLFQLPPINRSTELIDFAHTSRAWQQLQPKVCYISEQHRQQNDELLDLLKAMRSRKLLGRHIGLLKSRLGIEARDDDVPVTKLYTHNIDVDTINQRRLDLLDEEPHYYEMQTKGSASKKEQLQRSVLAPEQLELKLGAEIMFVANDTGRKYANGSRGTVVDFDEDTDRPIVQLVGKKRKITVEPYTWQLSEDGKVKAEVSQLPLRLAWAITIHKSQGMSLDAAEMDLSKAFTPGMGYVALSRVRSINGVYLSGINKMALMLHDDIHIFDEALVQASKELAGETEDIEDATEEPMAETTYDQELYDKLAAWRRVRADEDGVPPYVVAHDTMLKEIAQRKPATTSALLGVKGMGKKKLELYGEDILKLVC